MSHLHNTLAFILTAGMVTVLNAASIKSGNVYTKNCALCHGARAEGNPSVPDAPALNYLSKEELVTKLSDIKGQGFDNAHERMEKNVKIIELRGMKYDPSNMAEYIYTRFNKDK
jgi:mono/diheme cytochrome c family protein